MYTPPSTCSQPEPHLSTNVAISVTVSFNLEKTKIYFDAVRKLLQAGLELFSHLLASLVHKRGLLGLGGSFSAKSLFPI